MLVNLYKYITLRTPHNTLMCIGSFYRHPISPLFWPEYIFIPSYKLLKLKYHMDMVNFSGMRNKYIIEKLINVGTSNFQYILIINTMDSTLMNDTTIQCFTYYSPMLRRHWLTRMRVPEERSERTFLLLSWLPNSQWIVVCISKKASQELWCNVLCFNCELRPLQPRQLVGFLRLFSVNFRAQRCWFWSVHKTPRLV